MPIKPGARPPPALQYEPRHCLEVVEFMGRGYSLTAFAGEIGASRAELLKWCEKHPPFAVAVERAQARRARMLEDRLLCARGSSAFVAHMQALRTAAPDEWPNAPAAGKGQAKPAARRTPAVEVGLDIPDNGRGADDVR